MIKPVLSAVSALALLASPAMAGEVWDMSYAWPDSNFHVQNGHEFAKRVAAATDGEVEIVIHSGGALGLKGPEAMAAVRDGIVPIAEYSLEQQNGEVPFTSLAAMPGLAMGYEETRVLVEVIRPKIQEILGNYNQKLLYIVPWPGQGVYTKVPLNSLADLGGYKLRAANARAVEFFEALGAAPVLLPWAEVVPSLASGVINGVSTSSSSGVDGKFWEFLSDYSRFDWANPLSVVTVNLDSWNELSAESQAAIEAIAKELEPSFWEVSVKEDERNLELLSANGINVSTLPASLRKEIAEASEAIWAEFAEQAGEDARKAIADYREKVGK
ncbi:TRAP transporter substrate-binding protein [Geminicoccaceae bacterium 1502E]|nr:TRAP transporter substrate-binding protein [Geminicoccaceae bacterium 1502E]